MINTQEKEIKQEEVLIGEVKVPVIREDGELYYPISFVMSKVLFKKTDQGGLHKEYSQYIKKYKINYGSSALGGTQEVNCVSEEGLKKILDNSKIGRLKVFQKKAMNILLEYLHMDVICEDDRFVNTVSEEEISKYSEYIRDCITYVLEGGSDIVWQKCTKCNNYYPYHINFFDVNVHSGKDYPLYTNCRNCVKWDNNRSKIFIKSKDNKLSNIYNEYGEDIYKIYRDHDVLAIYSHWKSINKKGLPYILKNKEDKLFITKIKYDKGEFEKHEDLTDSTIRDVCGFGLNGIKLQEVYDNVLDIKTSSNGYKNFIDNFEGARKVVNEYINKNNIIIENIYDFNYYDIIRGCSLTGFLDRCCNNSILDFIMEYYNDEYPAYKFKGGSKKYWESKDNRIKALKYFIEEDMKIELDKVPLYITLTALRKDNSTMYNLCKKYYKSLFEWVNEVYPDRFDPKDFDIHYVRNDFGSIEEAEVHDILSKEFKHKVIYNPNNTDRTIKIGGKVPDWFVFGMDKCYIVEYFGLIINRDSDNSRVNDYKERTEGKIEIYEQLDGYGKVFIFPDDLKDNFSGLMEKLKMIH